VPSHCIRVTSGWAGSNSLPSPDRRREINASSAYRTPDCDVLAQSPQPTPDRGTAKRSAASKRIEPPRVHAQSRTGWNLTAGERWPAGPAFRQVNSGARACCKRRPAPPHPGGTSPVLFISGPPTPSNLTSDLSALRGGHRAGTPEAGLETPRSHRPVSSASNECSLLQQPSKQLLALVRNGWFRSPEQDEAGYSSATVDHPRPAFPFGDGRPSRSVVARERFYCEQLARLPARVTYPRSTPASSSAKPIRSNLAAVIPAVHSHQAAASNPRASPPLRTRSDDRRTTPA